MAGVQNEIKYRIAIRILQNLLNNGALIQSEFESAKKYIAMKYQPFSVCE